MTFLCCHNARAPCHHGTPGEDTEPANDVPPMPLLQELSDSPETQTGPRMPTARGRCADCATRALCIVGSLPQAAAAGLGPQMRERTFRQGDLLSRQGDRASHFKILKVGMVYLCREDIDGLTRPVAVGGRGNVFGICSFLQMPNQVTVVAATSGRYCEIATERVESLVHNDRAFRDRLGRIYAESIGHFAKWANALGRRSVPAQVGATLLLLAESQHTDSITLPPHTALAELLGTTRESVARALATLEAAGGVLRNGLRRCEIYPEVLRAWLSGQRQG